jgi:hypothetical protein
MVTSAPRALERAGMRNIGLMEDSCKSALILSDWLKFVIRCQIK